MAVNPDLIAPADGFTARLGAIVFSWQPATGDTGPYVLQIAIDAAFSNIARQVETTLTQVETDFPRGNFYYWRVKRGAVTSTTFRGFSAPPFSPASVSTHKADGAGRLLHQFQAGA